MPGFLSRVPDAWLQKAQALAQSWNGQASFECYDPMVVEYARYVHELSQLNSDEKERHAARNEVLAQVHYLVGASLGFIGYSFEDSGSVVTRHEVICAQRDAALIKAMILCDVDPETVAQDMGYLTGAIDRYEHLVFNIRSRLNDRGYIHNYVLNNTALGGVHNKDFEQLVLLEAYENGAEGVRMYLGLDHRGDKVLKEMGRQNRLALAIKAKTATRVLTPDNFNCLEVVRIDAQIRKDAEDADVKRLMAKKGAGPGGNMDEKSQRDLVEQVTGIGLSVANVDIESDEENNPAEETRALLTFEDALAEELKRRREEAEDANEAHV